MSATAPSQTVFSIGYDFHLGNGDNGNVFGITNYKDQNRNQTFTYDLLNRLTSAQNAGTDCTAKVLQNKTEYWGNNYGYDAWGNLLGKSVTKCGAENLSVTADAHNWLHASGTDYQYDAAGNMTFDATASLSYTFDQENRLTGAAGYTYTYDGDGNRVRKSNGNLASNGTLYWYMTPGVVAESDLAGTLKSEYVFFDGERVARRDNPGSPTATVAYYFSDHLKTASVITDSAGVIKAESDYYPWGGELQFVNNDSNDYKFTGKERDAESGLDYFGARNYSNGLGKFVQADPLYIEMHRLIDPQQLNLYMYGRNNPLKYIDPTGLDITCTGNRCDDYLKGLQKDVSFKVAYDKNGKVMTEGDIDKKSLSKTDKALLKAIDDPKHHVTINAIDGGKDSSVFFGASHGASHTIAFDQASLLDSPKNAGGMTSAQLVGHETLEGYAESQGNSLVDAHNYANEFFGGLSAGTLKGATYGSQNGNVVQLTGNFSIHGSSTTERITVQFATPIPQQDFLKGKGAPYPQYPINVEAVENKK